MVQADATRRGRRVSETTRPNWDGSSIMTGRRARVGRGFANEPQVTVVFADYATSVKEQVNKQIEDLRLDRDELGVAV